ncbi:hypothetical protein [Thermococcus sp. 21S7]|uniref:hypothetical protein n=1 Tax=Thermococcus sp. 21S7 TaxID=1638221 RepID=UPI00143A8FE1|nr:hypothetical protein [Thermococcus sp. 21S7]NJE60801.1 hypothetical protein [Thermococcus sp. 21S7]
MGKLDEFFKLMAKEESKKSDLEILEDIEEHLSEDNIDMAILQLKEIKKDHNLFLALRMIIRKLISEIKLNMESPESPNTGAYGPS